MKENFSDKTINFRNRKTTIDECEEIINLKILENV